jgi:hypothetical protein
MNPAEKRKEVLERLYSDALNNSNVLRRLVKDYLSYHDDKAIEEMWREHQNAEIDAEVEADLRAQGFGEHLLTQPADPSADEPST